MNQINDMIIKICKSRSESRGEGIEEANRAELSERRGLAIEENLRVESRFVDEGN